MARRDNRRRQRRVPNPRRVLTSPRAMQCPKSSKRVCVALRSFLLVRAYAQDSARYSHLIQSPSFTRYRSTETLDLTPLTSKRHPAVAGEVIFNSVDLLDKM